MPADTQDELIFGLDPAWYTDDRGRWKGAGPVERAATCTVIQTREEGTPKRLASAICYHRQNLLIVAPTAGINTPRLIGP